MSTLQERLRTSRGGTLWVACADAADRLDELERERDALRRLIADDAYAMTFQTLGQYRSALLQAARSKT